MQSLQESPASSRSTFIPVELDVPSLSQRAEEIRRAARASIASEISAVELRARAEVAAQRSAREAELREAAARADRSLRRSGLAVATAALLAVAAAGYVTQFVVNAAPIPAPAAQAR